MQARRGGGGFPFGSRGCGFTLIEMIGVLGGMLILALALAPSFIRHYDRLASEQEDKSMSALSEGLRNSIMRNRSIPNHTNWAAMVAAQLGMSTSQVTNNNRRVTRVFLIDPALEVRTNGAGLPYLQNTNGSQVINSGKIHAALSPRLMILSSLSPANPLPVISGVAANAAVFNNIWTAPDRTVPAGWTWSGRGDDLKIQRINLDDLFVRVTLNNLDQTYLPSFTVDGSAQAILPTGGRTMYYIKNTRLDLFNAMGTNEISTILQGPANFSYEFGTWRGDALMGQGISPLSPSDLQWAVNLFMSAHWNSNAKDNPATHLPTTQSDVTNAMINFMSSFCTWRAAGYPLQGNSPPKYMSDAQSDLATLCGNLTF